MRFLIKSMKKEKILVSIGIKAHDLAVEMTSINVRRKRLKNVAQITKEHVDNNAAVRQMLVQRGIVPEDLPPAEDVKQLLEQRAQSQVWYA